jgi:hypothetical protein
MDRRKFSLSLMGGAAAALVVGCGGGGGDAGANTPVAAAPPPPVEPPVVVAPPAPPGPELATATSLPATTTFLQTIATTDTNNGYAAPGQANLWALNADFSMDDGFADQFDGALTLDVDVGGTVASFAANQTYAELTALGPEMGAADGVRTVSFTTDTNFVVNGATSAVLHSGLDARLQQTLNLTAAAGHAITLTWVGNNRTGNQQFSDEPYFLQVVVRDVAGALLSTLFLQNNSGTTGTWGAASLTAFAGQTVVLSFEQRSTDSSSTLDDISVTDTVTSTEYVVNGDFEAGNAGWSVPASKVAQNIRSGARSLNGLVVERSFYTQPDQLWARHTDTFSNPSAAPITAKVTYGINLGSDNAGIIYPTPGATTSALSTWDGSRSDRDAGVVFGTANNVVYTSATAPGVTDGSEQIAHDFIITVPAGGMVTLINFLVLSGVVTGEPSSVVDASARATAVDTAAAAIANNFRTDFIYQRGLTQAQLDTVKNF